jgi:hypothetical protein
MPISTATTLSEPVGWRATTSPSISVTTPRKSVACQEPATVRAGGRSVSSSSGCICHTFLSDRMERACCRRAELSSPEAGGDNAGRKVKRGRQRPFGGAAVFRRGGRQ